MLKLKQKNISKSRYLYFFPGQMKKDRQTIAPAGLSQNILIVALALFESHVNIYRVAAISLIERYELNAIDGEFKFRGIA